MVRRRTLVVVACPDGLAGAGERVVITRLLSHAGLVFPLPLSMGAPLAVKKPVAKGVCLGQQAC